MAIWRVFLRPLLPWLGRLVLAVAAFLGVAWVVGVLLVRRAEPLPGGTLPADVPGRLVVAGGRLVHVIEQGTGDPVLLVHGFAGSTIDFEGTLLPALAGNHRAVAIDLLGMGFSARGDDLPYGDDLWARQLGEVMDALGMAKAAIVGHSLGGGIATIFAGERGDRVERLVLVAPVVPLEWSERAGFFILAEVPGLGELLFGTADHLPRLPGFSDPYHARAHEIFRIRGTRAALLRHLRRGRDTPRLAAAYRRITVPTLVVAGTADDIVPYPAVRRAVPAIRDVLVLPLDGVGHWIMRDAPERLADATRRFLRGDLQPSPPGAL